MNKMITKKHMKEYYTGTKNLLPLKRPSCGNGFNSQSSDSMTTAAALRVLEDYHNTKLFQIKESRNFKSGTLGGKTWFYPSHEASIYADSSSEEQSVLVDVPEPTITIICGSTTRITLGSRIPFIVGCFLLGILVLFGVVYLKSQPYSIIRLLFP
jgi:hypothetical protein